MIPLPPPLSSEPPPIQSISSLLFIRAQMQYVKEHYIVQTQADLNEPVKVTPRSAAYMRVQGVPGVKKYSDLLEVDTDALQDGEINPLHEWAIWDEKLSGGEDVFIRPADMPKRSIKDCRVVLEKLPVWDSSKDQTVKKMEWSALQNAQNLTVQLSDVLQDMRLLKQFTPPEIEDDNDNAEHYFERMTLKVTPDLEMYCAKHFGPVEKNLKVKRLRSTRNMGKLQERATMENIMRPGVVSVRLPRSFGCKKLDIWVPVYAGTDEEQKWT